MWSYTKTADTTRNDTTKALKPRVSVGSYYVYIHIYRLNHGFRRYRGIYPRCLSLPPEGSSNKLRGYSPVYLLRQWFNQFVARCDANQIVPPPCVVSIGMASGDYGSLVSFSLRAWRVGSGTRLTRRQPALHSYSKRKVTAWRCSLLLPSKGSISSCSTEAAAVH